MNVNYVKQIIHCYTMFLVKVQYIEYASSQTVMVDLDKMMQLKLKKKINLTTVYIELFVYK